MTQAARGGTQQAVEHEHGKFNGVPEGTNPELAKMLQGSTVHPPRIPYPALVEDRFQVDRSGWKVLCESVFPGAKTADSIVLALAYCKARNLDVFKRPVHIVPVWNSALGAVVETVWPGISELRTTASRTKDYAGKDAAEFGPDVTRDVGGVTMTYPAWCRITLYRIVGGVRCAFVGPMVLWTESYATDKKDSDRPNTMWRDRPYGQLEKCAEAAALRCAFPEEIGGDYIPEEAERIEAAPSRAAVPDHASAALASLKQNGNGDTGKPAAKAKEPAEAPSNGEAKPEADAPPRETRVSGDANAQPPAGWSSKPEKAKPGTEPAPWET